MRIGRKDGTGMIIRKRMRPDESVFLRFKKIALLLLCLLLALGAALPCSAFAQEAGHKVVRVGWYDSSYNTVDSSGRRSGYAYEYQLKIACYTGWTYEYVKGSWPELMEMLETGEIDLMSDVSYTPERAERMLFPSLPMGSEEYYVFTAPGNQMILPTDPSTQNGRRIGVNKNSIQADFYRDWAERNGVLPEIIEVSCSEDESLAMLDTGELDGYVTVDAFVHPENAAPVCKVGSSDFFFAVSKNRPDLLTELDVALNRIQDENRYYNQRMFEKYIRRAGANAFLSAEEVQWLSEHETIRVGYQDNYLAFCAADRDLFFHPVIDVTQLTEDTMPRVPEGALSSSTFLSYRFEGVEKEAAWLPLSNGMRLIVTVPVSETEGNWQSLIREILIVSALVLVGMSVFTMYYTGHITRPLEELTAAAQQVEDGNYNFDLDYNGNDEIGTLTRTFKELASHMKDHITDLNKRVYVDALTSVRNKGAFSAALEDLQTQMDGKTIQQFAVGMFDCDDLKTINDRYGHDKGDLYLKTACRLICRIFQHSPVFRVGGDEFAVILKGDDFLNRAELVRRF